MIAVCWKSWRLTLIHIKKFAWYCYIINLICIQDGCTEQKPLKCKSKTSSCSCDLEDGSKLDLSKLANNNKTARFSNIKADVDSFSWNPCNNFDIEGSTNCKNVAVCQIQKNGPKTDYYNLGAQDSAQFITGLNRGLQLVYSALTVTGSNRTSYIALQCDPQKEGTMTATGERPPKSSKYYMTLKSKHCCPQSGGGISTGTILVIIFVVLLLVYLMGGMLFMKFGRGAEGKELVPNVKFWSELPLLVRDGFRFIISGCDANKGSYQSV